jgi:hypothetical protein
MKRDDGLKELVFILVAFAICCVPTVMLGDPNVLLALGVGVKGDLGEIAPRIREWSLIVVGASFLAAVFWWVLGQLVLEAGSGENSWVLYWWLLLILPILTAVVAAIAGPGMTSNGILIALFQFVGGCLFYWIPTAMFSPPLVKYTPPGSRQLRFIK